VFIQIQIQMTITIQVDIMIRSDKVTEFLDIMDDDKKTALQTKCISSFDIIRDDNEPNKFILLQTVTSKTDLLQHMKQSHYRWKEFMKTGAVLAYKHTYL
jgi:quinol monooxygenase YgiN